eukprot:10137363-Ditylum_brightwellii.AAC.2
MEGGIVSNGGPVIGLHLHLIAGIAEGDKPFFAQDKPGFVLLRVAMEEFMLCFENSTMKG